MCECATYVFVYGLHVCVCAVCVCAHVCGCTYVGVWCGCVNVCIVYARYSSTATLTYSHPPQCWILIKLVPIVL